MTPIIMPQIGQDSPRGKIVQWMKKENDLVSKGEVVLTVESDKAVFEVTADCAGTLLKILYPEDTEVDILQPVAYIGAVGESPPDDPGGMNPAAETQGPTPSEPPVVAITPPSGATSPAVRRLARELEVNLADVRGTGPGGRILPQDVQSAAAAASSRAAAAPAQVVTAPAFASAATTPVPFGRARQRSADRLTQSVQTVPHFHLCIDVDMTLAQERRAAANRSPDTHITITDLVIRATALALRDFPQLNAFVERERMLLNREINIGVATATGGDSADGGFGLLVPVLPDADQLDVHQVSKASRKISTDARRGVIDLSRPATFTISSLGSYGITSFLPIINPPEAAILAVGAVAPRIVPVPGGIGQREMMTLTLACDHRAVDGVFAARFLQRLQHRLETLDNILGAPL